MSDELETRLRRDLAVIDDVAVGDGGAVGVAAVRSFDRAASRRRAVAVAMSVALVAAAGVGIWAVRDGREQPAVIDEPTATATTPVTTPEPPVTAGVPTTVAPSTWPAGVHAIAPDPRGAVVYPSVVWTGDRAVVVGGFDLTIAPMREAFTYSPDTDSWTQIAAPPELDQPVVEALATWTESEALIVGGLIPELGSVFATGEPAEPYGHAYDPTSDQWRVIATPPGFITARSPSVWTGSELLVWLWDGGDATVAATPVAYDPATDSWRDLADPPVQHRQSAASVWTGTEWIVWGGTDNGTDLGDGAAYDPTTDTWRVLPDSPLAPRKVRAVWTGTEMLVAAGSSGGDLITGNGEFAHGDGAAYDPVTDMWRSIASGPAHPGFEVLWTGREMLMFAKGGGVAYDPDANRWIDDCCGPMGQTVGSPVWTGSAALFVGSDDPTRGGVVYVPADPGAPADASPPATLAPIDPYEFDDLAIALLDVGANPLAAPPEAAELGDAFFCGLERDGVHDETARRCFLDRHLAEHPAVFVEELRTVEGDPIVGVWRALADGTIKHFVDSTRDSYGSAEWETYACRRLTAYFVGESEPLPPAAFACDAGAIEVVDRFELSSPSIPESFPDREVLPVCGYEFVLDEDNIISRQCFADAVQTGAPAEYAYVSTGDEGERSARWVRSLGEGTFEVFELQSGVARFNEPSQWLLHRCTTIVVHEELDLLPQLDATGACTGEVISR